MQEALYYEKQDAGVRCLLCPHFCSLGAAETGRCGVRREKDGLLFTMNYGLCAALAMDPIEKKPLYHFYPGRKILSIGTAGCNLSCGFCQNWQLATGTTGGESVMLNPAELIALFESYSEQNPLGIAYTYSEPGIWYEYVLAAAILTHKRGYKNVLVTNGFLNEAPLQELLPYLDALNIDVKAFNEDYYRRYCGGRLAPVLRYVEMAAAAAHIELTYLVIPTLNDSEAEIRRFVAWVAGLSPDIPVHFSRYYPQHKFTLPATPVALMENIAAIAKEKLSYVYLGNFWGHQLAHTFCSQCGLKLIHRDGYQVQSDLSDGKCPHCGQLYSGQR
ncbi:MAG: AmmeMemoRadiSam system radical SAM enzyme [Dethiobacter sp.]|nr:AmmeMemoRadiSam system radical SAM enzyme [Dethiobacter sp.]